ncbi:MAG: hypothetical protein H8E66_18380 [Planctomycetes bacterium]|nr:hypothetical protein [Planctomycetota bacterium]
MKGPFERLKYDLRRVWECPECHHKERAAGTVTVVVCRCQTKKKDPLDRVVMKLVEDRIQRRLPAFVPPADEEEPVAEAVDAATEETATEETTTSEEKTAEATTIKNSGAETATSGEASTDASPTE